VDKVPEGLTSEEEVAAWMQVATDYYQDEIAPRFEYGMLYSELCVGINWLTYEAKFLRYVKDRGYPDIADWVFGTMDLMGTYHKDGLYTLWVGDWKTGGTDGAEEQLLSLLAASRQAFACEEGELFDRYEISCLKVGWDPYVGQFGVFEDRREVTVEEIEAHAQAMAFQYDRLVSTAVEPVPGIHCTQLYCPHLAYCGAISDLIKEAGEMDKGYCSSVQLIPPEALAAKMKLIDRPANNHEASQTMELVSAAKRQLNYLTECMKDYVKTTGESIVSNGYIWGPGKDGYRWRKIKS